MNSVDFETMLGSLVWIFATFAVAFGETGVDWTQENLAFNCKFLISSHLEVASNSYDDCSTRCSRDIGCTHFQWSQSTCRFFQGNPDKEDAAFDEDQSSVCGIAQLYDYQKDGNCTCSAFQSRIVNGSASIPHNYKFQVGITRSEGSRPFCGGSLISRRYVMTAAHCVVGKRQSQIRIVVGEHNVQVSGDEQAYHQVESIRVHPNYDKHYSDYDFALVKLSKEVTISTKVGIICLPSEKFESLEGSPLIVIGWGTTQSGGKLSSVLRQTLVKGVNSKVCQSKYSGSKITNQMICAENPGTDSCQGDSGGPLFMINNSKSFLVGVVSFGRGCADPNYPGVYSRVSSVIPWIKSNSDSGNCQN